MCSPWTPRSRHSRRRWRRKPWTCVSPSCQRRLSGAEPERLVLKSKLIIALNLFHHLPKVFLLHLPVWMFSDEGVELFADVLKYITVARRHSTSSFSSWPEKRKSNNTLLGLGLSSLQPWKGMQWPMELHFNFSSPLLRVHWSQQAWPRPHLSAQEQSPCYPSGS